MWPRGQEREREEYGTLQIDDTIFIKSWKVYVAHSETEKAQHTKRGSRREVIQKNVAKLRKG